MVARFLSSPLEVPIFVYHPFPRKLFYLRLLYLAIVPIIVTILAPILIAVVIAWIAFVIYEGWRYYVFQLASQERIEFYDKKFKYIRKGITLSDGGKKVSEDESLVETSYSQISRFRNVSSFSIRRTIFYDKTNKPILNISSTSKMREFGNIRVADWIVNKANLTTEGT